MTMLSFLDKHIRADVTELFREFERQTAHTSLHAKAKKLSAPFLDYEAAARARGWRKQGNGWYVGYGAMMQQRHEEDLTPHEIPIIGYYIVTAELTDKLEARGERVERDFGGNIVWARKMPNEKWIDGDGDYPLDVDPVLVSIFEEGGL